MKDTVNNRAVRIAAICISAAAIVAAAIIFYKYILFAILPFLIGWLTALAVQTPIELLEKRIRMPRKISGAVFVLLSVAAVILVIILICGGIYTALGRIYEFVSDNFSDISGWVENAFDRVLDFIKRSGMIDGMESRIRESFAEYLVGLGPKLLGIITGAVGKVASCIPGIAVFSLVLIVSAFYFAADFDKINGFAVRLIPRRVRAMVIEVKNQFVRILIQFFKSYSLLALLCFAELYLGLTLLRIDHAFSTALLISVIDVLPVLGVGTVLVPWAIFALAGGRISLAVGLAVLFVIISVVRQIAEPKILGDMTGLHPLASLTALFLGLRLGGIFGMILLPFLLTVLKNLYDEGYFRKTDEDS